MEKENFVKTIKLTNNITYIDVNMKMVKEAWKKRNIDFIKKYPLLVSVDLSLDELEELISITGSKDVEKVKNELIELNNNPEFVQKIKEEEDIKKGDMNARVEIAKNLLNNDYEPDEVSMITDLSLDDIYEIIQDKL